MIAFMVHCDIHNMHANKNPNKIVTEASYDTNDLSACISRGGVVNFV